MPESPIRKLVPFAQKAYDAGKTVYHLNIGQPDIKTPEVALDAVKIHSLTTLAYTRSEGSPEYRAKIAAYYGKNDIGLGADDIMVTTGGSEALLFAFGATMDAGDEIIIPEPFYANYNGFAKSADVNIIPVESKIEENFALPPIEEFEKKITDKTKVILICNPGNPTGYLYSREEIEKLAEIVKKHNLFLIADEVYREFVYDNESHFSVLQLPNLEPNVIVVDSVSKRYSMCGARIGYLVSRNKEFMATALKFAQARLSPPTLAQIASEAALETPDSYFKEVVDEYVKRRDVLVDGLNNIPGVYCPKPKGAFYCVARFPVDSTEKFCQWLLEEFDYNNQTVMMAPASGFYATPGLGTNEARIAYVLNENSLRNAIECIEKALEVYPGRVPVSETVEAKEN